MRQQISASGTHRARALCRRLRAVSNPLSMAQPPASRGDRQVCPASRPSRVSRHPPLALVLPQREVSGTSLRQRLRTRTGAAHRAHLLVARATRHTKGGIPVNKWITSLRAKLVQGTLQKTWK